MSFGGGGKECRVHLPTHVAGTGHFGGGGCPPYPHPLPCPNTHTHTPNGQQAWCTLLRATSCVCVCVRAQSCVCVLLGVCSSNKGKHCVLHCLIRHQAWLRSALSACLVSVRPSVSSAAGLDGWWPLDHLEESARGEDVAGAFFNSPAHFPGVNLSLLECEKL